MKPVLFFFSESAITFAGWIGVCPAVNRQKRRLLISTRFQRCTWSSGGGSSIVPEDGHRKQPEGLPASRHPHSISKSGFFPSSLNIYSTRACASLVTRPVMYTVRAWRTLARVLGLYRSVYHTRRMELSSPGCTSPRDPTPSCSRANK